MTAITTRRTLCTTADAASILGVTMCRVRQLAKAGALWSELIGPYVRVFDRDEVTRRARVLDIDRALGHVRGPAPGGFKRDRSNRAAKARPGKTRTRRKPS